MLEQIDVCCGAAAPGDTRDDTARTSEDLIFGTPMDDVGFSKGPTGSCTQLARFFETYVLPPPPLGENIDVPGAVCKDWYGVLPISLCERAIRYLEVGTKNTDNVKAMRLTFARHPLSEITMLERAADSRVDLANLDNDSFDVCFFSSTGADILQTHELLMELLNAFKKLKVGGFLILDDLPPHLQRGGQAFLHGCFDHLHIASSKNGTIFLKKTHP